MYTLSADLIGLNQHYQYTGTFVSCMRELYRLARITLHARILRPTHDEVIFWNPDAGLYFTPATTFPLRNV